MDFPPSSVKVMDPGPGRFSEINSAIGGGQDMNGMLDSV